MPYLPTAAYSIDLHVELANVPNTLGRLATAIGAAGANIVSMGGFDVRGDVLVNDVVVNCSDEDHANRVVAAVEALEGVDLMFWYDRTFHMHEGGKIEVLPLAPVSDMHDLSMAYTPGVARICMAIHDDPRRAHDLTIKKNTVAIVSDGSAVLGLGDIGPEAAMPVMEGKALLFKEFAGVDAFPVCINTSSSEEIIETVIRLAPTFGGINLEDIKAPGAFEVEQALKEALDIPVFHDDQHGTAVVTLAALWNSLKLTGRDIGDLSVVISGVGAAGMAVGRILIDAGVGEIVGVDSVGAVYGGRGDLNESKEWFAANTNPDRKMGTVHDVLHGVDAFIGLSAPDLLTAADLRNMAPEPLVFAMANPNPEIRPEEADGLAAVMATGRSDYPNQINNVLAFPGIFRGALDAGATDITENMKLAAALAIADSVSDDELSPKFVVPSVFDKSVPMVVAAAVAEAAVADGVCRS
ncbi:MAG: NAD-dependent malic enzyme [Acidimicrobiaceae bacterium]|nr:NAD-dependent malic enzyme [Acidimicrobiaceae bacterium]